MLSFAKNCRKSGAAIYYFSYFMYLQSGFF